jgi:hypothetical protein
MERGVMYKVYRCEENVSRRLIGEYAKLDEAYAQAQREIADEASRFIHYRILGYLPWRVIERRETSRHRVWFVLDDDLPLPQYALRASVVLAVLADMLSADAQRSSPEADLGSMDEAERLAEEAVSYRILCLDNGGWYAIRDGFATQEEASDFLEWWRERNPDPFARYEIRLTPKDLRSDREIGEEAIAKLLGIVKPTDEQHSLIREDPVISRLIWPEEYESPTGGFERGLGISEQWGKGRRSRKGDYIP